MRWCGNMKNILKNISLIIIFILILSICTGASEYTEIIEGKVILVIGSYNYQNEWEQSVLKGFENIFGSKNSIKTEYLDSASKNTSVYYESFLNYLDAKYENQNIDYIFVMDDEALKIVKNDLFNNGRVLYKKPVFFVGINNIISLTEEEKQYMSGVMNIETCLDCISLIEKIHKDKKVIEVFCDDSIYSQSIIANISAAYPQGSNEINVNINKFNSFEHLQNIMKTNDFSDSVLLLCSTYINETTNSEVPSSEVIKMIKNSTKAPIYTTLYNYIEGGAVGGVVNDGEKLGKIGALLLNSVVKGELVSEPYILTPSYNAINTSLFNFRAIREYNINPFKLPEGANFINKKPYDLLLPESLVYIIIAVGAGIIFMIFYLIMRTAYQKKKLREVTNEAMQAIERENIKTDSMILMSHEFRTPLNIIINSTKLLITKCGNDEYDKEYYMKRLNSIIKNSNRLNRAVNNLIDVAKLELGIMSTDFKMYNIIKVVEDITDTIIDFASTNNIEVVFDTEEEEVYTAIDKIGIERIMLNLLSNAIKSIKERGKIFVNCRNDSKNVYIYIQDNGIGMSDDIKKHIFEKFFQGSEYTLNRRHEGNGLGLYIVSGLVKLHNGFISVESEEGKETTIEIIIPITTVEDRGEEENLSESLDYMAQIELSDID